MVPPASGLAYPGATDSSSQVPPSQRGAAGMSQTCDALGKALASVKLHDVFCYILSFQNDHDSFSMIMQTEIYSDAALHKVSRF